MNDHDGSPGPASRADAWERDVLRIVGHDLRGPLATILGWARILHHKHSGAASIAEAVATIERNVDVAITLVDDVCARLMLRRGQVDLTREPLDLDRLCRVAVERVRPHLTARGVTLTQNGGAGELVVDADPVWMQRIVRSLLSVAMKLTPRDGRVVLRTQRHGAAIRLSLATTPAATGSGERSGMNPLLELDVEREVIGLHGGTLSVTDGARGHAVEITMEMPAHGRAASARPVRAVSARRRGAASARRGRRRR
ncbi:MAG TPA: HAMP domain-containing sensor histidine kinase [Methylomirabilota bacterium]